MKYWLVLFKTWIEDEIDTPWPFVLVDYTNDFRPRTGETTVSVSSEKVDAIYQSFNAEKILEFEEQHIDAVMLSCVVQATDFVSACNSVIGTFTDAEIMECQDVPVERLEEVMAIFPKE